jgi:hypothetical protein
MIRFIFSPRWFYGIDSSFEVASIFVTLLIAIASYRFYKFSKEVRYKYFAWSLLAIAISFAAKILTNINVYYSVLEHRTIGFLQITFTTIRYSDIFEIAGFTTYRFLTLLGFLGLFSLLQKNVDKRQFILLSYCFFIISVFSTSWYYLFHLTLALLLLFICMHYLDHYRKQRIRQSRLIFVALLMILVSHIVSVFVEANLMLYVVAESLQLLGFLVLLYSFYTLKHDQKNKT